MTPIVAAVHATGRPARLLGCLQSLREGSPDLPIVVGGPSAAGLSGLPGLPKEGIELRPSGSASQTVNDLFLERMGHVLCVGDGVVFPADPLGPALEAAEADARIATVSFLSNAAGPLSFPNRNQPSVLLPAGHDEVSMTRRLRSTRPAPRPTPILIPAGGAVLFTASGFSALGPLIDGPGGRLESCAAEYGLRANERGFLSVVDPGTYLARPDDTAVPNSSWLSEEERGWLASTHPFFASLLDFDTLEEDSPLHVAVRCARTKALGLRVLVDGTCLGDREMGTQVQTLSLIQALLRSDDVSRVCVSLACPVPAYAEDVFRSTKIDARLCPADDLSTFGEVDVAHRPFQPDRPIDFSSWRKTANRIVLTIQDLIAYRIGICHGSPPAWLAQRAAFRHAVGDVDGVIVISNDVHNALGEELLSIDPSRVFVVPNGTDHLSGREPERTPKELLARGFVGGEFLLVLGADYGYKHRDLAIRAHRRLLERGWRLTLVMAGARVPHGSSRVMETAVWQPADDVIALPDVASEERNWLLRHASALLYPTSAEGFGLVPYEAAHFGTPTAWVGFGPLLEVAGNGPVVSADWSADAFADAVERFIGDPVLAAEQVASTLAAGAPYTWDRTADGLTEAYRSLVGQPARVG